MKIGLFFSFVFLACAASLSASADPASESAESAQSVPTDKEQKATTTEELFKKAHAGDAEAQAELGIALVQGTVPGISRDIRQASNWFKKSAMQKNAKGINGLSVCYFNGLGVPKDEKKAVELLREAAEEGAYPPAMYTLGKCYEHGLHGITQDGDKAFLWMKKSAEAGFVDAQRDLAGMYWKGNLCKKSREHTEYWLLKAARQGDRKANLLLADYMLGDPHENFKWLSGQVEKFPDDTDALVCLGLAYVNGTGTPQDKPKGVSFIRRAAEQASPAAERLLGAAYWFGWENGIKDAKLAEEWLLKAIFHDDVLAQVYLTSINLNLNEIQRALFGMQVEKNPDNPILLWHLGEFYLGKSDEEKNALATGVALLRKATERASSESDAVRKYAIAAMISLSALHFNSGSSAISQREYEQYEQRILNSPFRYWGVLFSLARFRQGSATPEDNQNVRLWLNEFIRRDAHDHGDVLGNRISGYFWLGVCYTLGWGGEPDVQKGVSFIRKAAELGDKHASRLLEQFDTLVGSETSANAQ